ncbi:glycosyltransferase family 57 protein [Jaapia argillacea MUCL 33604]|uniref:Alpha-1,3-glucosyltransferase n=1 Tax=Jaapia argillacea MUCL 33604 TaxID=933084 RepID=A0A067Q861_9AGAM|nr:glycosyltransferase family 57 protein [Jaapia argillacea MUCL 33604]
MEEFLTQFPPNGTIRKKPKRLRTTSTQSDAGAGAGSAQDGPSLNTPVLRHRFSTQSMNSYADSETSEIHAPIPRRHHIQTTETRHWLRSSSHSPGPSSSRDLSPLSTPNHRSLSPLRHESFSAHQQAFPASSSSTSFPSPLPHLHHHTRHDSTSSHNQLRHHLSFSALVELEKEKEKERVEEMSGMGRRWLKWMHRNGMKEWVLGAVIGGSMWVKWCVSLGSYSGQGTPPMFGDYEAQRHWMELTIHLPISEWYKYDLQYWGLDYPPLTAYVSWLCGIIGNVMDSSWFALDASRGIETPESKLYMRSTVLALDTLVYVPAVYLFTRIWLGYRSKRTQNLAMMTMLLQPSLILIDFGHFQYNGVMLGLTLLAFTCFTRGRDLLGCIAFVLSLGFKQMSLYYAPAIGSYLIGKCLYLGVRDGTRHFIRLGVTTLLAFLLLFLPFLPPLSPVSFPTCILDPITRMFPFNRGLFEDKVANFWCASDVVLKWRKWVGKGGLVKLSGGLTVVGFLPGVVGLVRSGWMTRVRSGEGLPNTPESKHEGDGDEGEEDEHHHDEPNHTHDDNTRHDVESPEEGDGSIPITSLLPHALLTSSLSFFLFSFQVHEKTILVPMLAVMIVMAGASVDSAAFEWAVLVNNVGVFSMWPLLKKDGLALQYIVVTLLWNKVIGYRPFHTDSISLVRILAIAVYAGMAILHILELMISPPPRYPDLFPVLNVLLSTPVFVLAWLWSIKCGIEAFWALGGLGSSSTSSSSSTLFPTSTKLGGGVTGRRERKLSMLSTISEKTVDGHGESRREFRKSLGVGSGSGSGVGVSSGLALNGLGSGHGRWRAGS